MDGQANPRLCVAALLPFNNGDPDWGSFERMLIWMTKCADFWRRDYFRT